MAWITVSEYAKKIEVNTPQVIYNWIAKGKLKKGKDWRKIKKEIYIYQIYVK